MMMHYPTTAGQMSRTEARLFLKTIGQRLTEVPPQLSDSTSAIVSVKFHL